MGKEYTLEELLAWDAPVHLSVELMYEKNLGLQGLLGQLFKFPTGGYVDPLALKVLKDFSTDPDLIAARQQVMQYLLELDALEALCEKFSEVASLKQEVGHLPDEFWADQKPHWQPETGIKYFAMFEEFLNSIAEIGKLVPGTLFDFRAQVDATKKTEGYRNYLGLQEQGWNDASIRAFPGLQDQDSIDSIDVSGIALLMALNQQVQNLFEFEVEAMEYFFKYAAGFRRLQDEGYSLVFPKILTGPYRRCEIRGAVNPLLFCGDNKDKGKVPIDIEIDELNPIRIITGENSYGKTMALRTRALVQLFAQTGLPIIAESAELTLVDKIYVNVGGGDNPFGGEGRFKPANATTFKILQRATPQSLLLLDEPTLGTYPLKAGMQSEAYLAGLVRAGYEVWIVTHHLDLADMGAPHPQVTCLMTEVVDGQPTYRLVPGRFIPEPGTVVIDYNEKDVTKALRHERHADHIDRLRSLEREGRIPADRMEQYRAVMKNLTETASVEVHHR